MSRLGAQFAVALVSATTLPAEASAHALAQRYDLPLPLGYFLAGAGAAVAFTFIIIASFAGRGKAPCTAEKRTTFAVRLPSLLVASLRVFGLAAMALLIAAGLRGNPNTFKNITPVAVWVIGWVGLGFFSALVGNLWPLINPWRAVFDGAHVLARPWTKCLSFGLPYPRVLGAWPACALLLLLAWAELVAPGRDVPANIAVALVAYSLFTWAGFVCFGPDRWLQNVEVFSLVFALFGRFAPLNLREREGWMLGLRPFAVGLLTDRPLSASMSAFVLLMLATVTTDGLMETPQWAAIVERVLTDASDDIRPLLYMVMQTTLLILTPLILTGFYLITTAVMAQASRAKFAEVSGLFVLSLVPIAIAYHFAHYFSLFAIAGQFMIPLVSDPFGYGWDLFGTMLYRIDIGLVDAKSIWYLAIVTIVSGHIAAVWLGHATAAATFTDARMATRSQYPMLVLMVCYTMLSLWILAQPIVEAGA